MHNVPNMPPSHRRMAHTAAQPKPPPPSPLHPPPAPSPPTPLQSTSPPTGHRHRANRYARLRYSRSAAPVLQQQPRRRGARPRPSPSAGHRGRPTQLYDI
ncbi:hypothetical protein PLESTM_000028400 [Pleodorina starrii]|nr:hypothetical protein PLESTM_000028400 [Pleodorina starrii]